MIRVVDGWLVVDAAELRVCADELWVCVASCVCVCLLSGAVVAAASVQVCSADAQRG